MSPAHSGPEADRHLSVHAAAEEAPARPGLVVPGGESWSWSELSEAVAKVEREVEAEGDGAETGIVASVSEPSTIIRMLALIERRVPVVPIDPRLPEPVRDARTALARHALSASAGTKPRDADAGASLERPLAFLFTSGTSGLPRAVELSRRAFLASAHASAERLGWRDGDRWLCVLPLAHVGGLSILVRCLVARRTLVLMDRFDVDGTCASIERDRVTIASLVPTMLARLLARDPPWHSPARLRAVLLGGAAASDDLWEEGLGRGLPLLETWGMTETCSQVATAIPGGDPRAPVPLSGWRVRSPEGRLEVRGAPLFTRYVEGNGDLGPPAPVDAGGWFRTGDLGRVNPDGSVTILGRADEMIVTGGQNVSPAEVERVLESIPGVGRAAVVGVPDPAWGETVAAALEPEAGLPPADVPGDGTVAPTDLARLLSERFSASNRPRTIVWMERLPETASGKIDRAEVRRRLTARHRSA